MDDIDHSLGRMHLSSNSSSNNSTASEPLAPSARECLVQTISQVNDDSLRQQLKVDLNRLLTDHDRLVTMIQQHAQTLEAENDQLKGVVKDQQQRYEKAVREMQFFKKRFDALSKAQQQQQQQHRQSMSSDSPSEVSSSGGSHIQAQLPPATPSINGTSTAATPLPPPPNTPLPAPPPAGVNFPLTPTSPQPSLSIHSDNNPSLRPSRSSSSSNTSSHLQHYQAYWNHSNTSPSGASFTSSSSSTGSLRHHAPPPLHSSTSLDPSFESSRFLRHNPSISSASTSSGYPLSPTQSISSTTTSTATNPMILQRRVDPLMFGGSDALWDTIAKSQGSDFTVEKIITNFLRRGGSPNTAKQSPTNQNVKYGYGMIHALIVTKTAGALDLLLQQGANPNAMTLSDEDKDKVTPCYLAAKVGWLPGLQRLVQAGGDLVQARGEGCNKTALHVAAECGHLAVVEFIVGYTEGALNHLVDTHLGATALHYACHTAHVELVTFLVRSCHIAVTHADRRGEQPIHWAARAGRLEIVALLIERFGCDVNAYISKHVPTPLEVAKSAGHKRVVEYLKSHGGLSSKKVDKKREEERIKKSSPTLHLQSTLAMNGLLGGDL